MRRIALAAAGSLLLAGTVTAVTAGSAAASAKPTITHKNVRVCAAPAKGYAACHAIRHDVYRNGSPFKSTTPTGYGPADLASAYNLSGTGGSGQTIAIVDAYDLPTAASDLATYRSYYKLPTMGSCGSGQLTSITSTTPCFAKVGQTGSTNSLAQANASWGQEIALDLDMASAACPNCNIVLVEGNSPSFANLAAAVTTASNISGVDAISNSYGGTDASGSSYPAYTSAANKGIAVTASTGDSGYGVQSPASFAGVVSVGGTNLKHTSSGSRAWTETAWSGAGSGCSSLNSRPSYQTSIGSTGSCTGKVDADVSAVADPNTGVAVYDSTAYQGLSGWMKFGGTSASSPYIGALFARAGGFGTSAGSYLWSKRTSLYDITSGSNGTCSATVLCTAGTGWDGPTGLGTPNGLGAF